MGGPWYCPGVAVERGVSRWREAWGRGRTSPGASAAGLLDVHDAAHELDGVEASDGGISLFGGDHRDESEAAGLLGVGVAHDLALLDL